MIAFLGDIHGDFKSLERATQRAAAVGCAALIQVGDLGLYPKTWERLKEIEPAVQVYAIDGNHEMHAYWRNPMVRAALPPRIRLLDRGDVVVIDGKLLAFLGGARSVDEAWQRRNGTWSPSEAVFESDYERLLENLKAFDRPVDMFVAHTPPQWIIDKHFDPMDLVYYFGLSKDWKDPSAMFVQRAWQAMGEPPLICGHMHRKLVDGQVRILDVDELALLELGHSGRL